MKYDIDGKIFRTVANTENGEAGPDTLFHYHQEGEIISADYYGGPIAKGHLLGTMLENGQLDFRYHHLHEDGRLMTGTCLATPELLPDGRLRLKEQWQWLSGDKSAGCSEVEEIDSV